MNNTESQDLSNDPKQEFRDKIKRFKELRDESVAKSLSSLVRYIKVEELEEPISLFEIRLVYYFQICKLTKPQHTTLCKLCGLSLDNQTSDTTKWKIANFAVKDTKIATIINRLTICNNITSASMKDKCRTWVYQFRKNEVIDIERKQQDQYERRKLTLDAKIAEIEIEEMKQSKK